MPRHKPSPTASRPLWRGALARGGWFLWFLLRSFAFFFAQVLAVFLIVTLVFVVAGGVSYYLVQQRMSDPALRTPNLVGYPVAEAVKFLHDEGFELGLRIESYQHNPRLEADEIISQQPRPGSFVKPGSSLRVHVSLGSDRLATPDLAGMNYLDAGIALRAENLLEGHRSFMHHAASRADSILSQDPPPGTAVQRGAPVHLLVSLGPPPERLPMPELIGLERSQAERRLRALGLSLLEAVEERHEESLDGDIFDQSPPPGTIVDETSPIRVRVAKNY